MGKGVAIIGIWAGVGVCAMYIGSATILVAFCAALATLAVCEGKF